MYKSKSGILRLAIEYRPITLCTNVCYKMVFNNKDKMHYLHVIGFTSYQFLCLVSLFTKCLLSKQALSLCVVFGYPTLNHSPIKTFKVH